MLKVSQLLSNLVRFKKPSFLTRLSNIILIQVFFVFTALVVIIYYPDNIKINGPDYITYKHKYNILSSEIDKQIDLGNRASKDGYQDIKEFVKQMGLQDVQQINLYAENTEGEVEEILALDFDNDKSFYFSKNISDELYNREIITEELSHKNNTLLTIIPNTQNVVHYYSFQLKNGKSAVLASISSHKYIVTPKSAIIYPLITLFLASTLVSLLLIYLIKNKFKEPLYRLMKGFEKTAQGEIYYMVETDTDSEINDLAVSFNKMTKTLMANDKKFISYNRQLETANIKLSESQEFLTKVIDNSSSSVIATTPGGQITLFNKNASEDFGYDSDETLTMNLNDLLTHSIEEIISTFKKNDDNTFEILCRKKDGTFFPGYMNFTTILAEDGEISAKLYMIRDISESKNFQEMMIRLDRYYTRGKMVGDIAHEINNFLAILSGNIELMPIILKRNDPEKITHKLNLMKTTVDKISNFTDGLMDAGEEELRFVKADINQLVETVLTFLKPQKKFDRDEIITDLSTDIPLVEFDEAQLQQLMVNLINNASDAMSEQESNRKIIVTSSLINVQNVKKVVIEVADSGPGIDEEKSKILFEKRFTTKRKGHGIGLIICKRIVDAHNGSIVYSTKDGACFTITIPVENTVNKSLETAETIHSSF